MTSVEFSSVPHTKTNHAAGAFLSFKQTLQFFINFLTSSALVVQTYSICSISESIFLHFHHVLLWSLKWQASSEKKTNIKDEYINCKISNIIECKLYRPSHQLLAFAFNVSERKEMEIPVE